MKTKQKLRKRIRELEIKRGESNSMEQNLAFINAMIWANYAERKMLEWKQAYEAKEIECVNLEARIIILENSRNQF